MSGNSAGAKKGWSNRVRGRIAGIRSALNSAGRRDKGTMFAKALVAWDTRDLGPREAKLVRRIFRSRAR